MKSDTLLRFFSPLLLLTLALFSGCNNRTSEIDWTLTGTVWKVAEINGEMVGTKTIPTLQLEPNGKNVTGFTSVNHISGTYQHEKAALSFGPLVATRMAGTEKEMKTETQFLQALASVTNYRTKGPWLVLLAGDKIVARAQATAGPEFPKP